VFGEQCLLFNGRSKPKPVCVLYAHALM
jgi:hypothetical protein